MVQLVSVQSVVNQVFEIDWDNRAINVVYTGKCAKSSDVIDYSEGDVLKQRLVISESRKRVPSISVGAKSIIASMLMPDENVQVCINNEMKYAVTGKVHHSQTGRIDGVSKLFFNKRYSKYIQRGVFDIEYYVKEGRLNMIPADS